MNKENKLKCPICGSIILKIDHSKFRNSYQVVCLNCGYRNDDYRLNETSDGSDKRNDVINNITKTMKEVYLLAQEHCGLKVGDYVKVARKAEDYEGGWNNVYPKTDDDLIGRTGRICNIGGHGVAVCIENCPFNYTFFPYFVLEKTEKPEHKFKPFDRVLVRDSDGHNWKCDLFSHKFDGPNHFFRCIGGFFKQCIPYEGNEHLVGTADTPKEENQ